MSSLDFTENCLTTTIPYTTRTSNQCEEAIDTTEDEVLTSCSHTKKKIIFFRSMGLEFSNASVLNADNNNVHDTMSAARTGNARPFPVAPGISQIILDTPEQSSGWESRSQQKHFVTTRSTDMPDYRDIVSHMRECSVTIIGDKCKVCGKNFKCIKDVQNHVKKKHRKKKSKKKLVLKIGDEVISRVPISRKHLKWYHRNNDRTIVGCEKAASLCNGELSGDQVSDEEIAPFVDLDSDFDAVDARTILTKTNDGLLSELKNMPSNKVRNSRAPEDEDIQVLLRITRPRTSGPAMEINHETPNRTERELLISDAIREFIRMDNEPMEIIESEEHEVDDIEQDCCWLANETSPNFHLDREERNCAFHIENDDDIEFTLEMTNSGTNGINNNTYFNDEKMAPRFKEFRNRNDDVLPNFVEGLDNPASNHCRNNNVYEVDSQFYNDVRINEWSNVTGVSKAMSRDSRHFINNGSSVLIKEEIMLEDIL